jgi:hypothetical protein
MPRGSNFGEALHQFLPGVAVLEREELVMVDEGLHVEGAQVGRTECHRRCCARTGAEARVDRGRGG